jgi:transforming growth factor-beta-induced protein
MSLIGKYPFSRYEWRDLGLDQRSILNPSNTTATPVPTATSQAVAFAGASSVSNAPFTSGISATTTTPGASTAAAAAALGMVSGAMGMAALFGAGAAVVLGP